MSIDLSRERLVELLDRGRRTRILVIGDAMPDVYLAGDVDRISPEAPVPVVRVRDRRYALGGAANVAQNVAAVGAVCHLVAAVGRDAAGDTLSRMLGEIGAADALLHVSRCTTQKTRIVARSQQLVRIDEEEDAALSGHDVDRLLALVRDAVARADAVVLEDYNKGVLVPPVIRSAIDEAVARQIPVVVDPKYRNFFGYAGATVFKPNRRELESAVGATIDLDDPTAVPELLGRLGVQHLLLTLGERGMLLASADGSRERIVTVAREVYDVVGAGDTVTAYLATMLAGGASAGEAAVIANVAAGIEVGKLGAASVSRDELLDYVDAHVLHV
jgi:D-beta-D-heptose 7-phosphate kinase/D-beta-D-heptose 1-phosphate adenosyltransferase